MALAQSEPKIVYRIAPETQAIFCRRRQQPRRPPLANIRPGRPAPTMGAGTTFMAPNSPSISPWIPSVESSVVGLPLLPPVPKPRDQRPPGILVPMLIGIVPRNAPVSGSKTLISLATKLKLPTSRSFANGLKLAGARVMPHGAARGVLGFPRIVCFTVVPVVSKIATAPTAGPVAGLAAIWAGRPAGA